VLLNHYGITASLISYTDHNKARRIPELLKQLGQGDVALVSDAGTPAISDPGVELAAAARGAGYEVVAVPGASAVVAALSVAGLPTLCFRFAGFLPRGDGELRRLLAEHRSGGDTLVAFESPQRLRKSLTAIEEVLPEATIAVCRELTKLHEEVFSGTATEALAHFVEPRGEIVLIIGPLDAPETAEQDEGQLREEIAQMKQLGLTRAQATALLDRRYSTSRRRLYQLWLEAES
jgi:16S rRNA (cytidine1402-2'-O)-methyltransferase